MSLHDCGLGLAEGCERPDDIGAVHAITALPGEGVRHWVQGRRRDRRGCRVVAYGKSQRQAE